MADKPATYVVTGKVRLSYAHLFEAHTSFEGQEAKFSCVILVPKSDKATMQKLRTAQQVALENGKSKTFGGTIPKAWKDTIRDGDDEDTVEKNPQYAGHWYFSASSKTRPGIVDQSMNPVLDATEVYSGCYVRVGVNCFPFSQVGNKGVSFGLNTVQKLADGEAFGGGSRPEDDFEAVDTEDDGSLI